MFKFQQRFYLLLLLGCSPAKPEPAPLSPTEEARSEYEQTVNRLGHGFLDRGMVISIGGDGHKGDSLLWSGLALSALPCGLDSPVTKGIQDLVANLDGGLARFVDIPHDISLDGAVGFYYGIARRIKRCSEEKEAWKVTAGEHEYFMGQHKGAINDDGFVVPPAFDFLQRAFFHTFGLSDPPKDDQLAALNFEVTTWANAVRSDKAACYRVHIGWLALRTAEELGYQVEHNGFCEATNGLQLAVIDQWCGRDGLKAFLDGFQYNQWEYKHQRCPDWESPDGNGYQTPAIDRLMALTMYYQL